jgi:AraC-like DNA-binding protein
VLSAEPLVTTPEIRVAVVSCRHDGPAWSAAEPVTKLGLVLVRSGVFRRRVDGTELVLDGSTGYLNRPGSEQRMAHPAGGDVCTAFSFDAAAYDELTRGAVLPRAVHDRPVFSTPEADLGHRLLAARARAGADRAELTERAVVVAGSVLAGVLPDAVAAGFPTGTRAARAVDLTRQAVAADPRLGLAELARAAGLSPYHLSRTFRRSTGLTLSRFRSRLMVRRALDLLAGGRRDLAAVAADTGFADQAHLTRTVRRETGRTPGELRHLLG